MKTLQTSLSVKIPECKKVRLDDGIPIFTNPGVSKREKGYTYDSDEGENLYGMLRLTTS